MGAPGNCVIVDTVVDGMAASGVTVIDGTLIMRHCSVSNNTGSALIAANNSGVASPHADILSSTFSKNGNGMVAGDIAVVSIRDSVIAQNTLGDQGVSVVRARWNRRSPHSELHNHGQL